MVWNELFLFVFGSDEGVCKWYVHFYIHHSLSFQMTDTTEVHEGLLTGPKDFVFGEIGEMTKKVMGLGKIDVVEIQFPVFVAMKTQR